MAITECKECGKEVSKRAKVCPHCGVDRPEHRQSTLVNVTALVIVGGFAWMVIAGISGNPSVDIPPSITKDEGGPPKFEKKAEPEPMFVEIAGGVRFDGSAFEITNGNAYDWVQVKMAVNSGLVSSGYKLEIPKIIGGSTFRVAAGQFAKSDGERFNPGTHVPKDFTIDCQTPQGRGFYSAEW